MKEFLLEYWRFLRTQKKWWLMPIILILVLISVILIVAGSSISAFVYTLF
jgi:competence protein ComGC